MLPSPSRPLLSVQSRIAPDADAMRVVRGQVRSLLADRGWRPETVDEVLLGLDEALMNACCHGGAVARCEEIELGIELHADRVVFEVCDRGAFDPQNGKAETPLPDDDSESGRGLFLIRRTMDEVRYEAREGGGTRVRLVKRR